MSIAALSRPKAKRRWTYDEFAAESPESNLPTELWDGEIIKSAAPRPTGVAEYWIIEPDSRLIEVFALVMGSCQLHARGVGAEKVTSKLLAGLKVAFGQLEA
jgi:Uma2 family endonuclease